VDPFLGLGNGLRRRGHEVAIATLEYFRDAVTAQGFECCAIRPAVTPTDVEIVRRVMDRTKGPEFLLRDLVFPAVEAMYDDLAPVLEGADLIVSHPLTVAAPIWAQHRGRPWASVVLAPMSFFSQYDVPVFPPAPWLKSIERVAHWPGRVFVSFARAATTSWPEPVHEFRARLGLPRVGNPIFEGQHSPHLVLALYSRVLGNPQPDWPQNVVVTGHMFHDTPHGTALDADVEWFLASGPPPVVFTLGSSAVLLPGRFWEESIAAVNALGCRAVLLVGPGQVGAISAHLPPTLRGGSGSEPRVLVRERAPHSLLMPRAAAVVHQCGVGTLGQSLLSGRPLLAVPHANDQPDNAYRASRLGLARVVQPHRYRARRVAKALETLVDDPTFAAAAARTATVVRGEGGVDAACDALETRFGLR